MDNYSVLLIVALMVVFIVLCCKFKKRKISSEDELIRKCSLEIKSFKPYALSKAASPLERIIYHLRSEAFNLNQCELFAKESVALWQISKQGDHPLLVMVMGEFKTGKSTFINTLLEDEVLVTDAAPATAVTSLLKYGEKPALTLYYLDGTIESADFAELAKLTAEGDASKEELRAKLSYVEIMYPNELLKKINLVDTPGLNVHKEKHIENTENFCDKADVVLWVFNATRSATRTEIAEIHKLGERLKPFAIVNRIDNIDEEEESVEEVLANVKRRLGESVQDVFGLSARQAQEALKKKNTSELAACGWKNFLETLNSHLVDQAKELKVKAMYDKTKEFVLSFENYLTDLDTNLIENEKKFRSQEEAEKNINEAIEVLRMMQERTRQTIFDIDTAQTYFETNVKGKTTQTELIDDREFLEKASSLLLNGIVPILSFLDSIIDICDKHPSEKKYMEFAAVANNLNLLNDEIDHEVLRFKQWNQCYYDLCQEAEQLSNEKKHIDSLDHEYKHSGFFGGEPIFDFSGRRKRLNDAVAQYNERVAQFKNTVREVWVSFINLCSDVNAKNKDIKKQAEKLEKFIESEIKKEEGLLKNLKADFEREKQKQTKLREQITIGLDVIHKLREAIA